MLLGLVLIVACGDPSDSDTSVTTPAPAVLSGETDQTCLPGEEQSQKAFTMPPGAVFNVELCTEAHCLPATYQWETQESDTFGVTCPATTTSVLVRVRWLAPVAG